MYFFKRSLACVIYECIELKYAFDGLSLIEVASKICSGSYPILENESPFNEILEQ